MILIIITKPPVQGHLTSLNNPFTRLLVNSGYSLLLGAIGGIVFNFKDFNYIIIGVRDI